jgi:ABC-type branched-subunit amino acid transport system substrate-binding protein
MRNKIVLAVFLSNILAQVLFDTGVQAQSQKIKVGVMNDLTGSVAPMGLDTLDGIKFANDYYLNGRFDLIVEDDRCTSKTGLGIAQKFATIDKVKYVLGVGCNQVLLSVARPLSKAGIVVVAGAATTGDVDEVGQGIFRPYPADNLAIPPLVKHLRGRAKRVGILSEVDEYTELMIRTFVKFAAEAGIEVVSETVAPGTTDFKPNLLRLKAKNVEYIFFNPFGEPGYISMVRQAKELGINKPLLANLLPASPVSREALGNLDDGVVFSDLPFEEASLGVEGVKVLKEITSRYGARRSGLIFSFIGIDIARMLAKAIDSGEPVESYLRSNEYDGFVGKIKFNPHGAVTSLKYSLRTIKDQKIEQIKE